MLVAFAGLVLPVLAPLAAEDFGVSPIYVGVYVASTYGFADMKDPPRHPARRRCSKQGSAEAELDDSRWPLTGVALRIIALVAMACD